MILESLREIVREEPELLSEKDNLRNISPMIDNISAVLSDPNIESINK